MCEYIPPKITKVIDIPNCEWHEYEDGSGALVFQGIHYFDYDLNPYYARNGIEFRVTDKDHYDIYWGNLENFKKFAESELKKMFLCGKE